MERTVARHGLIMLMPFSRLIWIEGEIAGIDLDCRPPVVACMGDPAALSDHWKVEGLAAPKLGEHGCGPLGIVSADREMEDHLESSATRLLPRVPRPLQQLHAGRQS